MKFFQDLASKISELVNKLPNGIRSTLQNTVAAILAAAIIALTAWLSDANLVPDTTPELEKQNELLKQQVFLLKAQNEAFAIPTSE